MKKHSLVIYTTILILVGASCAKAQIQTNKTAGQDTPESPLFPMSWELQLGASYITNTNLSVNKPLSNSQTLSGSFYTFISIAMGKKRNEHSVQGFSIRPGIGASINTFGLNKILENKAGQSVFTNFMADTKYAYSYLQQVFVDVPLSIAYSTASTNNKRHHEFAAGGTIGYMVYKESCFLVLNPDGYTVKSFTDIKNLNPLRYGVNGKITSVKQRPGAKCGFTSSLSATYYFSELYMPANNTPTKSFSVMLGIGFFIDK